MKNRITFAAAATVLAAASTVAASELWGVTGDGSNTPETLFTISITDASITFKTALGHGADGEGLGYNPNDGLLYHTSGISNGDEYFETVNPITLVVGPNLSGGTYGPDPASEIFSIEWYQPLGVFLATDISSNVYHVTTGGQFALVGNNGVDMRGLAVAGNRVFSINPFGNDLWEINPNDGSIINTHTLIIDGQATSGNGLAVDPDTGIMYAVVKIPGAPRALAVVDYDTGIGSKIGFLGGENFAGITFIPAPSTLALLGLGGLTATRRRRRA